MAGWFMMQKKFSMTAFEIDKFLAVYAALERGEITIDGLRTTALRRLPRRQPKPQPKRSDLFSVRPIPALSICCHEQLYKTGRVLICGDCGKEYK